MNRTMKIFTLACATGALLIGTTDWAQASPYDSAYGVQWTDQKGGDSNRTDGRGGSVEIDPITGKVIVGVESQDATFGPVLGGLSIQSGYGIYSKTGVFEFGYMATLDSEDSDSQHYGRSIDIDSSGNIYQGGNTRHDWPGVSDPINNSAGYVQKRTIADGTYQWTALVDPNIASDWQPGTAVAVDSTGATWLAGYANSALFSAGHPGNYVTPTSGDPYDPYLAKINADGTFADIGIQQGGAVQADGTAANDRAYGVAIDPNNDNIIAMTGWSSGVAAGSPGMFPGTTYDGGSRDGFLGVYDATGKTAGQAPTLVFGKMLNSGDATGRDAFYSVTFAPDGDVVVGGYKDGDLATGHQIYVEKYDVDGSSGTVGALVWSDTFGDASGAVDLLIYDGVKFDGDGNMYVMAYTNGAIEGANAGGNDLVVRKYDSSLTAGGVWTTQFGTTGNEVVNGGVVSGDKTEIYIAAQTNVNWPDGGATLSGGNEALLVKMTPGDFDADGDVDHDDQNALGIAVRDSNNAFNGDFVADGLIKRDDLDFFIHEVFDTFYGDYHLNGGWDPGDADGATRPIFAGGGYNAISDLDNDFDTDAADLTAILTQAAVARGDGPTPYKAGDVDWDKDVDITDFNLLASNFDPAGINGLANGWAVGDFNGDLDVDISDFNTLASNFAPSGYADEAAAEAADADPGKIDLVVDIATGEVWVDGNAASISGFQIVSNANGLVPGDLVPAVLTIMVGAPTAGFYAEGAFANTAVNGLTSLGILYDVNLDTQDLAFEYTFLNNPNAERGAVIYVPEPASLVLMGLGGLMVLRRRRRAA